MTQPPRFTRILLPDKHRIRNMADAEQHVLDAMGLVQWWTVSLLARRSQYGEPHVRNLLVGLVQRGAVEGRQETLEEMHHRLHTRGKRAGARRCLNIYRRVP